VEGVNHGSTFVIPSDSDILTVLEYTPKTSFTQQVNITSDSKVLSVRLKDKDNKTIELHGAKWWFFLLQAFLINVSSHEPLSLTTLTNHQRLY
jgi:hypothetical protein